MYFSQHFQKYLSTSRDSLNIMVTMVFISTMLPSHNTLQDEDKTL